MSTQFTKEELRYYKNGILWGLVRVSVAVIVLCLICRFVVSKAHAAKPVRQPFDVNSITFAWDANQVSDVNNIVGAADISTNTDWSLTVKGWCSRDESMRFTTSHGTFTRPIANVDPNSGEKVSSTLPVSLTCLYGQTSSSQQLCTC